LTCGLADPLDHADLSALRSAMMPSMAVKVGGMYVGGRLRNDNMVCRELRDLSAPVDFDDYVVDLCFMTYTPGGLGSEYAAGVGVAPGMVGRKQRRSCP